jgi:hypothetical protein
MEQGAARQGGEELAGGAELAHTPEGIRIREGIAEALRDGSPIDHETAWMIARIISPGSGVLHQLATTGEISPEIGSDLEVAYQVLPQVADTWDRRARWLLLSTARQGTDSRVAKTYGTPSTRNLSGDNDYGRKTTPPRRSRTTNTGA